LIIRQTADRAEIKAVLCHPVIYDTISDDDSPNIEDYEPPINENYKYIGGYVNSKIVAIMIYHRYLDGNECHVQVLPDFRKEHAIKFGEQSLEFRGTRPLYAEIPTLYINVLRFALTNNFEAIDERKNDYIKNGKTYNVKVLRYRDGIC
jgi:hypothetical protein